MLRTNGFLRDTFRLNLGRLLFAKVHRIIGRRMRYLVTGGSRFEGAIGRDFFCMGFDILQAYGLTECTGGATLIRREHGWTDSVGTPLDGVEVKIAPSDKTEGQDGEVLLRGPNIMQGYYNRADANAEVFQDGWFRTGDLGYLDRKGFLHITGRKKEMIALSSGKNIYPEDVESHYLQTPYIKELCVLGITRPGEPAADRLHAVIVPDFDFLRERQIVNTKEILRFEIENLSIQAPASKRVLSFDIWTDELPRTTTRKLKRFAIEQLLQERRKATQGDSQEQEKEVSPEDEAWIAQPDVERALAAILETTNYDGILLPDTNIELDLGLDSMERVELLAHMEKVFSAAVPEDLASGIYTVRELVEAVLASQGTGGGQTTGDSWKAMLEAPLEDDPDVQGILKPKPFVTPVLFGILKILYGASRVFFRFRVEGRKNFPSDKPFIFSPNHQSYLDAFLLVSVLPYATFRRVFFVGASEYFETPLMRRLARMANIIPVDPDANLLRAMQAGASGLRNGKVLILFPEGERSIDGKIKKFKKGAPILSLNLGVPIVPVALEGLFEVWPRGRAFQGFAPVRMEFGKPLLVEGGISQSVTQAEAETLYASKTSELRDAVEELWLGLVRQAS
jgi:long-chain acyl-CoA synthetase